MIARSQRFPNEVALFSAILPFRHAGLDPASITLSQPWSPGPVRGDDDLTGCPGASIASEVARFSGLFP